MPTPSITHPQLIDCIKSLDAIYGINSTTDARSVIAAFITPLCADQVAPESIGKLLDAWVEYADLDAERNSPFTAMDEKQGAYERATRRAYRHVQSIANAIVDGGTP